MPKCFIVVSQSRSEGMSAQAFYTEPSARKFISDEVADVNKNLVKGGYTPYITFRDAGYHTCLTAVNEEIYYKWDIIPSEIS